MRGEGYWERMNCKGVSAGIVEEETRHPGDYEAVKHVRITRACAERRGPHVRPRRTSRIRSLKHVYRCLSGDAPRNRVRQVVWRDAARQSGPRAGTAE